MHHPSTSRCHRVVAVSLLTYPERQAKPPPKALDCPELIGGATCETERCCAKLVPHGAVESRMGAAREPASMTDIDALIICALPEEYEAARTMAAEMGGPAGGVKRWREVGTGSPVPYIVGDYRCVDGGTLRLALARPTRMGENSTAPLTSALADRLRPHCLAMSGVCAGNPSDVTLGDVIVAEMAYKYTEGKTTVDGVPRGPAAGPTSRELDSCSARPTRRPIGLLWPTYP